MKNVTTSKLSARRLRHDLRNNVKGLLSTLETIEISLRQGNQQDVLNLLSLIKKNEYKEKTENLLEDALSRI